MRPIYVLFLTFVALGITGPQALVAQASTPASTASSCRTIEACQAENQALRSWLEARGVNPDAILGSPASETAIDDEWAFVERRKQDLEDIAIGACTNPAVQGLIFLEALRPTLSEERFVNNPASWNEGGSIRDIYFPLQAEFQKELGAARARATANGEEIPPQIRDYIPSLFATLVSLEAEYPGCSTGTYAAK